LKRDKRRFFRQPIKADFFVKDATFGEPGELYFASQNVSVGGAFLISDFLLEMGSELRVRFQLPGEPVMQATARVAWVSDGDDTEPGMGIAFTEISAENTAAIQRYIQRAQLAL
jgi:uncharacterized protein (TIGR02266 family)